MFNILLNCHTPDEMKDKKIMYYPQMNQDDINELESVKDHEQYPTARCAMNKHVRMYTRSSSQMVEAMSNANKRMRVCSSVDLVNATILLLKMEADRYEKQKDFARNCDSVLTPKGSDLRTQVLQMVKETDESFKVIATKIENDEDPIYYE